MQLVLCSYKNNRQRGLKRGNGGVLEKFHAFVEQSSLHLQSDGRIERSCFSSVIRLFGRDGSMNDLLRQRGLQTYSSR